MKNNTGKKTATPETKGPYTYTLADGKATITEFDASYSGDLSIANELGGCPVAAIGEGAFRYCRSLTSVTLPDSVTIIGDQAFNECSSLKSVKIPASVTLIGSLPFLRSKSLIDITVDLANPNYSSLDGFLFNKTQTTLIQPPGGKTGSYSIPDSVTTIGKNAFCGCSLTHVTIPSSITALDGAPFFYCDSLVSVTIPDSVTAIGIEAFSFCSSLKNVAIPSGVTAIDEQVFNACSSLTSVTIPSSVTAIGDSAFAGCTSLSSVTIPDSVTAIGDSAFSDCRSLASIYFTGNAPKLLGKSVFWRIPGTIYHIPGTTGWIAIYGGRPTAVWQQQTTTPPTPRGCATDETEEGPYTYTVLDGKATIIGFDSSYTGALSIPSELGGCPVAVIGEEAFRSCSSLASVTIPSSVTAIDGSAFQNCESLTSVTIPDSVAFIGDKAFCDTALASVTIPSSVTAIANGTFSSCHSLASVTIPDSVTSIGDEAFKGCESLTSVKIPDGVTAIGKQAFSSCESLSNVTIPASVSAIGKEAYSNCGSLANVYFAGNAPKHFGETAFSRTSATVYYLPGTAGWRATYGGRPTAVWQQGDSCGRTALPAKQKSETDTRKTTKGKSKKKVNTKKYKVFASSHHGCSVGRIVMEDINTPPDFKKLDILYPVEMLDECTDECMLTDNQIWFEDQNGNEVARIDLDPWSDNGVEYIDGGEIFDESDKSIPYFYYLQIQDKWIWKYDDEIEIEGEILPEKISVMFRRMLDDEGKEYRLMDYGEICYDGKSIGGAEMFDDCGNDGDYFWTVYNGVRTKAPRPRMPDDHDCDED